jgi:mono/diheme cytochrome c family protein
MSRWLTRLGIALGALVVLLIVAVLATYAASELRVRKRYAITPSALVVPTDSASIARGRHLAQAIGMCVECHGEKLEGRAVIDGPLGRVVARNLTGGTGGVGTLLTDADYVRAIRHGVGREGRALIIMPAQDYIHFTDADLAAVIAYVKSVPPSDNVLADSKVGPLGRGLLVAGELPMFPAERLDHAAASPTPVAAGGTSEYGGYLARIACMGCHGPALAGGAITAGDPSWPPASNLTVAGPTKAWSEKDFVALMRTGRRPDRVPVNSAMPWKNAGRMTDEELHAIWSYLRSIPGLATSEPTRSASVSAMLAATSLSQSAAAYFTWSIAQVQKIASSGDIRPRGDNLESE